MFGVSPVLLLPHILAHREAVPHSEPTRNFVGRLMKINICNQLAKLFA